MSLSSLLTRWQNDATISDNIAAWRTQPARQAQTRPLPAELHPTLVEALQQRGIEALYTHQAAAWVHARLGEHVAVVTGTASGKTLCYNLPVLDALLRHPEARALYLFPTKALAQDQLNLLRHLVGHGLPPHAGRRSLDNEPGSLETGIYDGDTPSGQRQAIRSKARLILSNPDMLHTGILPHHTVWSEFFRHLRFVVIDEMHTYRGVFGSHFANVLRRLRRVAAFYGAEPQFILTSATIANPGQLAEKLVELSVHVIDEDGALRGEKHFLVYNPPVIDRDLGIRRSLTQESVRLAADLLASGVQTILFGRTRRTIEVMLRYLQAEGGDQAAEIVRGYRSGYLAAHRREIEQGLRSGKVRAVVATSALELGVDIGQMEAALLAGYPGTIASTWQQAGRAGRGDWPALSVLVTSANPLDQFLARHPDYFFGRSPEQALVNPDNPLILLGHLRCAAFELPFRSGGSEEFHFGSLSPETVQEYLEFLLQEGVLHRSGDQYFWMSEKYPAQGLSLRSAGGENVVLQAEIEGQAQAIGIVDLPSAVWFTHPGAVYLHEGVSYLVEALDLENHLARLSPTELDYYTEPLSETNVASIAQAAQENVPGGQKAFGEIQVTTVMKGFRKIRWFTGETLGQEPLDLPPSVLQTTGYWLSLSQASVDALSERGLWSNAPNDYGPLWSRLRLQVRKRDGYRCQVCGTPESEGHTHDVHHKIPFRTFASAEQANQFSNLVTLCPACHRRAEAAVRMRSGLAGLAYALGNLAPLFVMCDSRDLGVHSDPQSPLAGGQPAIVLYDRIPAGIGLAESLYRQHNELLLRAHELVAACECSDGCPSCVGPGGESGSGGKREALAILEILTAAPSPNPPS